MFQNWNGDLKVQSPYLYLQSAGSDSSDGSATGFHLRWELLRNLGDSHLPKGNSAGSAINFNKPEDFVRLHRTPYQRRFPTIIDFEEMAPDVVHDAQRLWVYVNTNTQTTVYLYFRDIGRYDAIRAGTDPMGDTLSFMEQYGDALLEATLEGKLGFIARFGVEQTGGEPILRAEALSVVDNTPLPQVFVSCRKTFTNENWCDDLMDVPIGQMEGEITKASESRAKFDEEKKKEFSKKGVPGCCDEATNFVANPDFEKGIVGFETNYNKGGEKTSGSIHVTDEAAAIRGDWSGRAQKGKQFLAVNGARGSKAVVWRQNFKLEPGATYCFSGWLSTLNTEFSLPARVEVRVIDLSTEELLTKQTFESPEKIDQWEFWRLSFVNSPKGAVRIEIYSQSFKDRDNDFGLDNLYLCKGARKSCMPMMLSENIRSVRMAVQDGFFRRIELETYDDFIRFTDWIGIDDFALSLDDARVLRWLEDAAYPIDGRWPKFNDGATVRVANYEDRWQRNGGIREAVDKYIQLSDTDPMARDTLPGQAPEDGSIQVSYLDMLRIVAADFHVARMLGLGHIDTRSTDAQTPWIHLAFYDTFGNIDDGSGTRPVRHFYMTIPTRLTDHRLPEVPVLQPIRYGLYLDNGGLAPSSITDANGYTPDGQTRFISLFMEQDDPAVVLEPFFSPPDEFCAIQRTNPVFFGIEYKKQGASNWVKPELSHDENYQDLDSPSQFETLPIPNNGDANRVMYVHQETESGRHLYAPYGINWFSRASAVGAARTTNNTQIVKANQLLPPANFKVQLIQSEDPLVLTTAEEQTMLGNAGPDKTLIRVTFDYFHTHELNHQWGDQVELFFRQDAPRLVEGGIKQVNQHGSNNRWAVVRTEPYHFNSNNTTLTPSLPVVQMSQFVGGVLAAGGVNYIIVSVVSSTVAGEGPVFTVEKKEKGIAEETPPGSGQFMTVLSYEGPKAGDRFSAVENMADENSWGGNNPLTSLVTINDPSWPVVSDSYTRDGEVTTEELRGLWDDANIANLPEVGTGNIIGVYRIQLDSKQLAVHPQSGNADPVYWHRGVVRIERALDPGGPRKVLEVLRVNNIGTATPLEIIAFDPSFDPADPIVLGANKRVNYYPGYRLYLHADASSGLTEANILPTAGDLSRRTWMSARSKDSAFNYLSALGIPAPVIAMGFIEPLPPEAPSGGKYATRPDFYFKSTYTFSVQFTHQPFSAAFYRASEDSLLRALYSDATVDQIKNKLAELGEDDPYRADRWKNLVSFDYIYNDSSKPYYDATLSNPNNAFRRFPREAGNYRFPRPNKSPHFDGSKEPGQVLDKVKAAIFSAFTPLTEQPLLYSYIKGGSYQPQPNPQKIRDDSGVLLDPGDPEMDQAPMAKKLGGNRIQFTDFTLDGASQSFYFYMGREIGSRGKMSDPSPISGPVFLINTRPPDEPGIKKVYTQPPVEVPLRGAAIKFEVNGFPIEQNVKRLTIFRTDDPTKALSIRSMEPVKTYDLVAENWVGAPSYQVEDDFEDGFVPYGDPLYYRIVAYRRVKNADGQQEWVPSIPSKLMLTAVIDSINPEAPALSHTSSLPVGSPLEVQNVELSWTPTAYNSQYHLEKMNRLGNWEVIYKVHTNQPVTVDLASTSMGTNVLRKQSDDGRPVYHRFRVRVENSAGLFNVVEKEKSL